MVEQILAKKLSALRGYFAPPPPMRPKNEIRFKYFKY